MLTPEQQDALRRIARAAVASEKATGVPAELTAAQCIFESAWLTRAPGNNCFGIKRDGKGDGVQYVLTHEYLDGQWKQIPLAFEVYPNLAACFSDHSRLIQTGVYAPAWQKYSSDHDLDALIKGVAAHYATDPEYAKKIALEANSSTVQLAVQAARQG
ncbi:MAG: glucosaminidase domain-containing protein [Patescibacteria group bacterium]|nr:glucosaminidase domain-containing protein [Patescibacteria group bacterium]